jgi:hypothetical protein
MTNPSPPAVTRALAPDLTRSERFARPAIITSPSFVLRLLPTLAFILGLSGCTGYQLGPQSLFRPDIRTVHVPMFESDSLRRNLGERVTEAVVKEIERQSTYKVIHDPTMADSILSGRLVSDRKSVLAENRNDEPRDIQVDLVVQVSWVDRRGEAVMPSSSFTLAQQGFSVTQISDFIPEAGQSVSTAQQEAINRIAKQVVAQMEAPW